MKKIWSYLIILLALGWSLAGCSERLTGPELSTYLEQSQESLTTGKLLEVAPPTLIGQLQTFVNQYQPQVSIVAPKSEQVLQDTTVEVQLQVQDLPIFKDPDLEMGFYLQLIVDNELYQPIYDFNQPVVLENLAPGTHTLRVFAERPWHESFKNEGAYAQTTFHIFTKTDNNNPAANLPLLTYSRPNGNYGAEPILLDFYLTNAPLHIIAQESSSDEIVDWRIRVTINGQSFLLDNWQPIYLKGFEEGNNWVQLEFIDESGNPVSNVYNNTVKLIHYNPNGQDTLAKLVRGELSLEEARVIIDPNYKDQSLPVSEPSPEPSPTEEEPPISDEEIVPEDLSSEEEKTLSPSVTTPAEETPTSEAETRPEIPIASPDQPLPEDIAPTTEIPPTVEESQQPNSIPPSLEEPPTVEEKISLEKSTPEVFSSEEQSAITEEQTPEITSVQSEENILTSSDKSSVIPPTAREEQSPQTGLKKTAKEVEPLKSDHSSSSEITSSDQPSKSKWWDKIWQRLKRD